MSPGLSRPGMNAIVQRWLVSVSGLVGATALFAVMVLVFVAVLLRYFGIVVPDSYDLSRMLLGVLIFWGIALAVAENALIKVDALFSVAGPRGRRMIRAFAAVVTAIVLGLVAWRAGVAVVDAFDSKVSTSDLRLRLWPYYAVASTALFLAVAIALGRMMAAFGNQDDTETGSD